jgi:coenzyme Q-binding protein COQ10
MPHFTAARRVAVSPDLAYAVAADVQHYKDFLPLLERCTIRGAVTDAGNTKSFSAELVVGYAKLNVREKFISKVVCDAAARTVTATSNDSPFRDMKTVWSIRDVNGQSDVSITIDYSLNSLMKQMLLSGVMDMAVARVMSAFEARALALHKASQTS